MTNKAQDNRLVEIPVDVPVWDRFYTVAPLVLIGTREPDGSQDFAPKHMVTPMGWQNYFGFVCSPAHSTCINIKRTREFTVSYPRPSQILQSSLAASPRQHDHKPILDLYETFPARVIDGALICDAYLHFECRHFKIIDGFGMNCLVTGQIVAACAAPEFVRSREIDDQELVHESPLMAYLPPGRFASIDRSNAFPFPANMKR